MFAWRLWSNASHSISLSNFPNHIVNEIYLVLTAGESSLSKYKHNKQCNIRYRNAQVYFDLNNGQRCIMETKAKKARRWVIRVL